MNLQVGCLEHNWLRQVLMVMSLKIRVDDSGARVRRNWSFVFIARDREPEHKVGRMGQYVIQIQSAIDRATP
jgi:hypothetical protein